MQQLEKTALPSPLRRVRAEFTWLEADRAAAKLAWRLDLDLARANVLVGRSEGGTAAIGFGGHDYLKLDHRIGPGAGAVDGYLDIRLAAAADHELVARRSVRPLDQRHLHAPRPYRRQDVGEIRRVLHPRMFTGETLSSATSLASKTLADGTALGGACHGRRSWPGELGNPPRREKRDAESSAPP